LITEKTSPTFFADAIPLLYTISMYASWVNFTFITIWALPSGFASVIYIESERDR